METKKSLGMNITDSEREKIIFDKVENISIKEDMKNIIKSKCN
jgi:chorismate mutase